MNQRGLVVTPQNGPSVGAVMATGSLVLAPPETYLGRTTSVPCMLGTCVVQITG